MSAQNSTSAAEPAWKYGNELAAYHPQASHVSPDYRDGWNHCYRAAQAQLADLTRERDAAVGAHEAAVRAGLAFRERELALRVELAALKNAAQSVVERWDTPLWKDAPATAVFINRLRIFLDPAEASTQAPRVPAGWLPIETAPMDGTWILVAGPSRRTSAQRMVCRWVGEWESADDGYGAYINPTHWMPLPAPPGIAPTPAETAGPQPLELKRFDGEARKFHSTSSTVAGVSYDAFVAGVRYAEHLHGIGAVAAKEKTE